MIKINNQFNITLKNKNELSFGISSQYFKFKKLGIKVIVCNQDGMELPIRKSEVDLKKSKEWRLAKKEFSVFKKAFKKFPKIIPKPITIVSAYDDKKKTFFPTIIMDHIEGETLISYCFKNKTNEESIVLKSGKAKILKKEQENFLTKQIFLSFFKKRFHHGDLHSGNIIISKNKQIFVIDFQRSKFK
jgi:aminoglycoside phosphotransferase (APT) family kinase protein